MTKKKRSKKINQLTVLLREYAAKYNIKIRAAYGLTKDNYQDAVSLVDEFGEIMEVPPPFVSSLRNYARSPQTGIRLDMTWVRSL